ncbi:MAG TPA: FAD-dependent oxidoreductase [Thermoanaerobaculia bacterium]|nr:FAD-dependent oxidoreductase [Thermoanaerobaculia bacterium]
MLAAPTMMSAASKRLRVMVIGAGAFGGWTALHLRRRGAEVTLLDAWGAGNSRASSGGESRVIRAVYGGDRIYVEMVKRAYELWEQLDRSLYVETGALWLHRGDDDYVRAAAPHLRDLGFPLERLELAEAKKRWPEIALGGVKSVWLERRAGALSARVACGVVRDAFVAAGGTYRIEQAPPSIVDSKRADVYVFACGPWLRQFVTPTRQEVHFFGTPAGSTAFRSMPIWVDFGERIFYGIPDTSGRGFKVADDTRGPVIDPTTMDRTPSPDSIARARALLAERFPQLANAPLLESRVCQYENSPDGHLILDRHPDAANAWVAGGGSGHGFKLGPAVGEMMADAILGRKEVPALFRLSRERASKTQWKS